MFPVQRRCDGKEEAVSDRLLNASVESPLMALRRVAEACLTGTVIRRDTGWPEKRQLPADALDQGALPRVLRRGGGRMPGGPERANDDMGWVRTAWRRYRSRHRIARLDGQALRDIGVTYAEAEAEANKPFWRV